MKDIDRLVFDTAFSLWTARGKIYDTRQRLKRYTYGDQWGDMVFNDSGQSMIESDLIKLKGRRPITNNLIRRLVKTIVGRYRDMATQNEWYAKSAGTTQTPALLEELDSRLLEEFLISGMAVQRVADDEPLHEGSLVVNVNPEAFFCNDFRDPRGYDIEMAGMLHDMSPAQVIMRFAGRNKEKQKKIAAYLETDNNTDSGTTASVRQFYTAPKGRHRIIEVWSREFNGSRVTWRARWFTPTGRLLDTYESPWAHGKHPFAIKFYPLTDGEVHSFVEDIVDQQRFINRLIVLIDSILKTSAKGVLLFPATQMVDNWSMDKIEALWAKPGGVIPITGKSSILPQQLSATGGDNSAYRLLEMELRLFDQTSGVGQALLGTRNNANMGADHYRAQVENASIALSDIFRTFRSLITYRDTLL